MTLANLFWRNAKFLTVAEIILRAKSLVIMPIMTAQLGTVDYGVWAQVNLIVTMGPLLILLGTDHGIMRYLPGMPEQQKIAAFYGWVIFGTSGALILASVLFAAPEFVANALFSKTEEYAVFIPLAAGHVVVTVLLANARRWYRLRHDGKTFSIIAIFQAVFGIVAVLLMKWRDEGAYELVLYMLVADTLLFVWLGFSIVRSAGLVRPDFSPLRRMILFGLPLLPASIGMWVLNWIDRFFIVHYLGLDAVGIYSLVYSLAVIVSEIVARPIKFIYPAYSAELVNQGRMEEYQKLFNLTAGGTFLLMMPAIAGLWLVGPALLDMLATDAFASGSPVLPLIVSGMLLNYLAVYYTRSVELSGRPYWTTFTVIVAATLNAVLNVWLIPLYGITGAAIATLIGFAARLVIGYMGALLFARIIRTNWLYMAKTIIATLVMAASVLIVQHAILGEITGHALELLISPPVGAVVYALTAAAIGLINLNRKGGIRNMLDVSEHKG